MTGLAPDNLAGRLLAEQPASVLQTFGFNPDALDSLVTAMGEGHAPASPNIRITISQLKPERILERTSLPVWGQGQRLIGWLLVFYDVTEEEQVSQAREIITETLIHDLRSPLTATVGALEVIEDEMAAERLPNPIILQSVKIGQTSTQRVLSLVESLLDISRMQSGSMGLALAPVDLRLLADSVLSETQAQAGEYGLTLCNEVPLDLPQIPADAGKLGRVLVNLVDNALKYSPSGGKIVIMVDPGSGNEIIIRVSDDGPGIPDEYREKIFERFAQIPHQRGRSRGSGLGLTFCKLAVEAHGGRIWVEPRPGGGSLFSFTLPLERDPA
jgi:signal transduction histidine kinase